MCERTAGLIFASLWPPRCTVVVVEGRYRLSTPRFARGERGASWLFTRSSRIFGTKNVAAATPCGQIVEVGLMFFFLGKGEGGSWLVRSG